MADLLQFTNEGIYCPAADVYIDPWRPVERALITHGHADHARWGHQYYLCTTSARPVIQYRLRTDAPIETIDYGESRAIHGVRFSFHPAGHLIGSAQIRVEYKGEVWVVSGDYKVKPDGLAEPFEPVKCHTFITESTFGLPIYRWPSQEHTFASINNWWRENAARGITTVLAGYSLGKAQRILHGIDTSIGPVLTHGAVEHINEILREQGIPLPATERVTKETPKAKWQGGLVIAPPSALASPWIKRFAPASIGIASGWMALRGTRRRRAVDRGFVLSDHADWDELNEAIAATGAERVITTHGYTNLFARWLQSQHYEAIAADTQYEGELAELGEGTDNNEEEE